MDRRTFMTSTALTAAVASLPHAARAQAAPIRVGLMAPLTGVLAAGGKEVVEGFNLFFEQNGKKLGGRDAEIIIEDDASNPDTALQKARRLVEQRNVDFLIGNILANTGLAVAEYVKATGTPYFIPVIAADELTQRKRLPNVIRVAGYTASQTPRPLADYVYKKRNFRKIVTISQDYTFGHEQCGGFSQLFTELGGTIVQQFWHPLNTADFSPYLSQIMALAPDAVFAMETGADSTRFIQQYKNFGLKDKIALIGSQNFSDQSVIRTLGPECEGLLSSAHFCEGNDAPATRKFVDEYEKANGKLPSIYGFSHYSAAMWLDRAIASLKGDISNRDAFLKAVSSTTLENSPLGRPVHLDAYGNPIYDVFIREVKRRPDGRYWNVPVTTYPNVSQFWTYNPEEYMKRTPYSRNYQGISK